MRVVLALDLLSAIFAFAAAGFWLWSANVKIPAPGTYWEAMPETAPFLVAFRLSVRLSRTAAICAGVSAILTAVSMLIT